MNHSFEKQPRLPSGMAPDAGLKKTLLAVMAATSVLASGCVDSDKNGQDTDSAESDLIDTDPNHTDTDTDSDTPHHDTGLLEPPTPQPDLRYRHVPLAGPFEASPNADHTSLVAADINGDGALEVVAFNTMHAGDENPTHLVFQYDDASGTLQQNGILADYAIPEMATPLAMTLPYAGFVDLNRDGAPELVTSRGVFWGDREMGLLTRFEPLPSPDCGDAPNPPKSLGVMNLDEDPELELVVPVDSEDAAVPCEAYLSTVYAVDLQEGVLNVDLTRFIDELHQPGDQGFAVDPYFISAYRDFLITGGRTAYPGVETTQLTEMHSGVFLNVGGEYQVVDPFAPNALFREFINYDQLMADALGKGANIEEIMAASPETLLALLDQYNMNLDDYRSFVPDRGFTYSEPMGMGVLPDGRMVVATTSENGNDVFMTDGPHLEDRTLATGFPRLRSGGDGTFGNRGWYLTPWGVMVLDRCVVFNHGWDAGDAYDYSHGATNIGLQWPEMYCDSGYSENPTTGLFVRAQQADLSRYVGVEAFPQDLPFTSGHSACATDLNQDGAPDLLMGTSWHDEGGGDPYVLMAEDGSHWISISDESVPYDATTRWTVLKTDGTSESFESPWANSASPAALCSPVTFIHVESGQHIQNVTVTAQGAVIGTISAPEAGRHYHF